MGIVLNRSAVKLYDENGQTLNVDVLQGDLEKYDSISNRVDTITESVYGEDKWNESKSYAVGDYVVYNDMLWKCIAGNSGKTPSEGTYWKKVTIKQLSSDMSEMFAYASGYIRSTNDWSEIALPDGFTYANSRPIALNVYYLDSWRSGQDLFGAGEYYRLLYAFDSTNGLRVYNTSSRVVNSAVKILMIKAV